MELARAEREDLAGFLATLSPEQWQAPSLCEGWRVHDVVAHMLSYDELSATQLASRMARDGSCPTGPTRSGWPSTPAAPPPSCWHCSRST